MKQKIAIIVCVVMTALAGVAVAGGSAAVGAAAPDFTLMDTSGTEVSLSD